MHQRHSIHKSLVPLWYELINHPVDLLVDSGWQIVPNVLVAKDRHFSHETQGERARTRRIKETKGVSVVGETMPTVGIAEICNPPVQPATVYLRYSYT